MDPECGGIEAHDDGWWLMEGLDSVASWQLFRMMGGFLVVSSVFDFVLLFRVMLFLFVFVCL